MKKLLISLLAIVCVGHVLAQDSLKDQRWYVTTNLLSPLAGLNKTNTAANVLVPLVSNLEYGVTLSGGYTFVYQEIEARLTYGRSNEYNIIPQVQLGYNYYLADKLRHNGSNWYLGLFGRYWMYRNTFTDYDLYNFTTNLTIGHKWEISHLLLDLRLNQPLTIFTSSDQPQASSEFQMSLSPMPEFSPVLPFLSINVGYAFY